MTEILKDTNVFPLGDTAMVVQFGEKINADTHNLVHRFCSWLEQHPFHGLVEYVPAFTNVTLFYNPLIIRFEEINLILQQMAAAAVTGQAPDAASVTIEIPVLYGGQAGPDLNDVAALNNLSPDEVIDIHTQPEYLVYMIGFAPGFPYLGGMDKRIAAPRRQAPRSRIPAGSVGIAGEQTGVYPIETPGGWQIIGRTPLALFDRNRTAPALLKAGDKVKFTAIGEQEFEQLKNSRHGH